MLSFWGIKKISRPNLKFTKRITNKLSKIPKLIPSKSTRYKSSYWIKNRLCSIKKNPSKSWLKNYQTSQLKNLKENYWKNFKSSTIKWSPLKTSSLRWRWCKEKTRNYIQKTRCWNLRQTILEKKSRRIRSNYWRVVFREASKKVNTSMIKAWAIATF